MEIVYDMPALKKYISNAVAASDKNPVLLDRYIQNATEVDVDVLCDGKDVFVAGVLEHLEEAGVHSGDSTCSLPPFSLSATLIAELKRQAIVLAQELKICGLMNVQFAIDHEKIYILEVNPRASRTIPFIAKATGLPIVKIASQLMIGKKLKSFNLVEKNHHNVTCVKRSVFPFVKYPDEDGVLGPEMKSTGEIMAIEQNFSMAFAKAAEAVNVPLPLRGQVFISVKDTDKPRIVEVTQELQKLDFKIISTRGTAQFLKERGLKNIKTINKVLEGSPHIVDLLKGDKVDLIINTTIGEQALRDSFSIRRTALEKNIPYFTTIASACGAVSAIAALQKNKDFKIYTLQDL